MNSTQGVGGIFQNNSSSGQSQRPHTLKYLQKQRSIDQDQHQKIMGLSRQSAVTKYLIHKQNSQTNQDLDQSVSLVQMGNTLEENEQVLGEDMDQSQLRDNILEVKAAEKLQNQDLMVDLNESGEGNTKGTIQNEQDFNQFYGMNSNSMLEYIGGPEPAPTSTIHDNTATFRCKENNSHYNAYDVNEAEMNSVNYQHASKDDVGFSKHQQVQSIESLSAGNNQQNQRNNAFQKQNMIVVGSANVMSTGSGPGGSATSQQQRLRHQYLKNKQKQINMQQLFEQCQNLASNQTNLRHTTQTIEMGSCKSPIKKDMRETKNCANFQNQQSSVFTEQADIISPDDFDEFVPIESR